MEDKTVVVEGVSITVKTVQISLHPLVYKISAAHVDGASHEESLTLTNGDLTRVPTLENAQKDLDAIRQSVAQKCHRKFLTSNLASSLK
jgi:hypothetical protein